MLHARRADANAVWHLELEDVGEVAVDVDLEGDLLRVLTLIADPQVFMDPAADDPVPLDRDGRTVAEPSGRQRPKDTGGVIIDDTAGEDS